MVSQVMQYSEFAFECSRTERGISPTYSSPDDDMFTFFV